MALDTKTPRPKDDAAFALIGPANLYRLKSHLASKQEAAAWAMIVHPEDYGMPLMQGEIIGYNNQSMSYQFTMLSQSLSVINCEISSAALSDIAGPRTLLIQKTDSSLNTEFKLNSPQAICLMQLERQ